MAVLMVRATVDIRDSVLERARVRAAGLGIPLKKFIADAVTKEVARPKSLSARTTPTARKSPSAPLRSN